MVNMATIEVTFAYLLGPLAIKCGIVDYSRIVNVMRERNGKYSHDKGIPCASSGIFLHDFRCYSLIVKEYIAPFSAATQLVFKTTTLVFATIF